MRAAEAEQNDMDHARAARRVQPDTSFAPYA